jgi:hypothetical protein
MGAFGNLHTAFSLLLMSLGCVNVGVGVCGANVHTEAAWGPGTKSGHLPVHSVGTALAAVHTGHYKNECLICSS